MKILLITYSYTPDLTPRAFRWAAVAAHLATRGHKVDVLCSSPIAGDQSFESVDGVCVVRAQDWLLNASSRVAPGAGNSNDELKKIGFRRARSSIRNIVRYIWRALYWPDYACGWIFPAAQLAARMCKENDYDWVVSVSHPFTGHVVGMLAKRYSSRSKWFVDISDPFADMREPSPNNFSIYSRLNRMIESRIVAGAEIISVTTDSTKTLYETSYPISQGKIHVIPPLLSLPEISHEYAQKAKDGIIRLVFVGTLYKKLRSPRFLLACFSSLIQRLPNQKLELHFYGSLNDCGADFIALPQTTNSRIYRHGLVSRLSVAKAMDAADVLVNIGNDSEAQLASKVIEYMAMGKPILNIVSVKRDASVAALIDYPATLTILNTDEPPASEIVEKIAGFIIDSTPVDRETIHQVRSRYSEENVAGIYATILENAVSSSRSKDAYS